MSYIGSSAAPQFLSFSGVRSQSFNGDGTTTAFTMSRPVENTVAIEVLVNNVQQSPFDSSYSVSGSTLTFSEAPSSGTGNVYVIFRDAPLGSLNPLDGSVTTAKLANGAVTAEKIAAGAAVPSQTGQAGKFLKTDGTDATWETVPTPTPAAVSSQTNTATDYFALPVGTTAQRPASPATGMVRYNTDESEYEVYDDNDWKPLTQGAYTYSVEYLVVAGGGGGGGASARGAGGAGGYRSSVSGESSGGGASAESPLNLTTGTSYTVTIGAGGANGGGGDTNGFNGTNSVLGSITSLGGGYGGGGPPGPTNAGGPGGSGGGSNFGGAAGTATAGQGYNGGVGSTADPVYGGGGGGGAGAAGSNGTGSNGGNGGNGVSSSITGSSVTRGGGGAGGTYNGSGAGTAGTGGGGAVGTNGTANTGGGGGGCPNVNVQGGAGGSGVVIIRYLGSQKGTGGTVTSAGGYTIHTFTSSGTFTA